MIMPEVEAAAPAECSRSNICSSVYARLERTVAGLATTIPDILTSLMEKLPTGGPRDTGMIALLEAVVGNKGIQILSPSLAQIIPRLFRERVLQPCMVSPPL